MTSTRPEPRDQSILIVLSRALRDEVSKGGPLRIAGQSCMISAMSESKPKTRSEISASDPGPDDIECDQCDAAARLGLTTEQGQAVTRDASSVIGREMSLPQVEAAAKIFALLGDA